MRHQYEISALFSQTSFRAKPPVSSRHVGCSLRLGFTTCRKILSYFHKSELRLIITWYYLVARVSTPALKTIDRTSYMFLLQEYDWFTINWGVITFRYKGNC